MFQIFNASRQAGPEEAEDEDRHQWCVPGQPSKAELEEHDEPDKDDPAWRMVHDGILLPSERPPSQHLLKE